MPSNMTVVRNVPRTKSEILAMERHNERKNENYSNCDVVLEHSDENIYFKKCEKTYIETFNEMVKSGEISTRGQKENANIMGEMILDVNSRYFEENGGYEFAKKFYEEAYKFAVQQVGDEKYILSAVMHADERNKPLSDEFGKDVFHYHLHVVYIPIVDKEILWSKRCKDKELVGTVKEVIHQVSHSKKWKSELENGIMKKSYSKLQDDFNEYMRSAGYDVERGQKGSDKENLSVLEFKSQAEIDRLAKLVLQTAEKEGILEEYNQQIEAKKKGVEFSHHLDQQAKPTMFGDEIKLPKKDFSQLQVQALSGISLKMENDDLKKENDLLKRDNGILRGRVNYLEGVVSELQDSLRELKYKTKEFLEAVTYTPKKVWNFIKEVLHEKHEQEAEESTEEHTYEMER